MKLYLVRVSTQDHVRLSCDTRAAHVVAMDEQDAVTTFFAEYEDPLPPQNPPRMIIEDLGPIPVVVSNAVLALLEMPS